MSEQPTTPTTPTTPTAAPPAPDPATPPGDQPAEKPAEDSTDWRAEARKWEARAKENGQARAELEKQRKAAMTDHERALAEAEERGRTSATSEYGKRVARLSFEAAAARRNAGFDAAGALKFLDLGQLLGEDGEPDEKAVSAAVEHLIPAPNGAAPSFDGGARTTAPTPATMTGLIRKAAGRA